MLLGKPMASAALAFLIAACGRGGSILMAPRNTAATIPRPLARSMVQADEAARGNIFVAHEVRAACGLADEEAYFAFDLFYMRARTRKVLRALADCFVSGPLQGREIRLIGQVDLQGPRDRNESVAQRRVTNVRRIITAEITPPVDAFAVIAKEAIDSTGSSGAPWVEDGCVDVQCVDVVVGRLDRRSREPNEY